MRSQTRVHNQGYRGTKNKKKANDQREHKRNLAFTWSNLLQRVLDHDNRYAISSRWARWSCRVTVLSISPRSSNSCLWPNPACRKISQPGAATGRRSNRRKCFPTPRATRPRGADIPRRLRIRSRHHRNRSITDGIVNTVTDLGGLGRRPSPRGHHGLESAFTFGGIGSKASPFASAPTTIFMQGISTRHGCCWPLAEIPWC